MKAALLIDGGYFGKLFKKHTGNFPWPKDVTNYAESIMSDAQVQGVELFRIYYYDCIPYSGKATNPISDEEVDYSTSVVFNRQNSFIKNLSIMPKIAFRSGTLKYQGWKLSSYSPKKVYQKIKEKKLESNDLDLNLKQKKVDIKIGLDIDWLSSKKIVDKIILVTGDTDFIPAMKFARIEGVMVYMAPLANIGREMKEHCDGIIEVRI